jgi:hypothetical protein
LAKQSQPSVFIHTTQERPTTLGCSPPKPKGVIAAWGRAFLDRAVLTVLIAEHSRVGCWARGACGEGPRRAAACGLKESPNVGRFNGKKTECQKRDKPDPKDYVFSFIVRYLTRRNPPAFG